MGDIESIRSYYNPINRDGINFLKNEKTQSLRVWRRFGNSWTLPCLLIIIIVLECVGDIESIRSYYNPINRDGINFLKNEKTQYLRVWRRFGNSWTLPCLLIISVISNSLVSVKKAE